jgi:transcriptional regulator GlxA family with amidase domain
MLACTLVAFEGMDLLDAAGPYEVLLTASRLLERDGHEPALRIVAAALRPGLVHAYGGLGLAATSALQDIERTDLLIVPGAIDTTALTTDVELLGQVSRLARTATVTLSVCTGAFLLAAAGLLDDRPWTTHHEDMDALVRLLGPDHARPGARWVDSGQVVTSGGLSSGIAGALHVVDRLFGRDLAQRTARQIEYDWTPTA